MYKKTYYASAARSTLEEILNGKKFIVAQKFFTDFFIKFTGIAAIVDQNRQIVYANHEFMGLLQFDTLDMVLGKGLGEAISCVNSAEAPSGCGTYKSCEYCGIVNAILESQINHVKSSKDVKVSSIINGKLVSLDFNITSSPVDFEGCTFYVIMLQDISAEKRLQAIEKVFFHDLLNVAGGLNGLLTVLKMGVAPEEIDDLIAKSEEASQVILDEIMAFSQIKAAESGDIRLKIETVNTIEFLTMAIRKIEYHSVGVGKKIELANDSASADLQTDRMLLLRVLINLLKNALEATEENGVVAVTVKEKGDKIVFYVKNCGVIPEKIQLQIFQRSFSTKDRSRGIGTYSVKLFTENYLNGKVSFVSNETEGTVFSVELNRQWQ